MVIRLPNDSATGIAGVSTPVNLDWSFCITASEDKFGRNKVDDRVLEPSSKVIISPAYQQLWAFRAGLSGVESDPAEAAQISKHISRL
ncbi:hypothetical protein BELL_0082g00040 [Botrytis elliptica]|uniref:Uncharacterized protein n=1 Tax=Botrytis elliptica TaxID=278938 RepID=A0A4Z1JVS8_9HELO|nr:hypothetical protein BELL_0082g00040 [Botrytis elliptica]